MIHKHADFALDAVAALMDYGKVEFEELKGTARTSEIVNRLVSLVSTHFGKRGPEVENKVALLYQKLKPGTTEAINKTLFFRFNHLRRIAVTLIAEFDPLALSSAAETAHLAPDSTAPSVSGSAGASPGPRPVGGPQPGAVAGGGKPE